MTAGGNGDSGTLGLSRSEEESRRENALDKIFLRGGK
jgi:hypothetical protein